MIVEKTRLKSAINVKLTDIFWQNWNTEVQSNDLCKTYRIVKQNPALEHYLTNLDSSLKKRSRCFFQVKSSLLLLVIHGFMDINME